MILYQFPKILKASEGLTTTTSVRDFDLVGIRRDSVTAAVTQFSYPPSPRGIKRRELTALLSCRMRRNWCLGNKDFALYKKICSHKKILTVISYRHSRKRKGIHDIKQSLIDNMVRWSD